MVCSTVPPPNAAAGSRRRHSGRRAPPSIWSGWARTTVCFADNTIPPAESDVTGRSRQDANMYFSGWKRTTGKGVYPFTDDCNRIENGSQSTNVPPREGRCADPRTATGLLLGVELQREFESGLIHSSGGSAIAGSSRSIRNADSSTASSFFDQRARQGPHVPDTERPYRDRRPAGSVTGRSPRVQDRESKKSADRSRSSWRPVRHDVGLETWRREIQRSEDVTRSGDRLR